MKLKKAIIFLSVLLQGILSSYGQKQIPVIHSHTKVVGIKDGKLLKAGFWNLDPSLKPDTYFVDLPRTNPKVTFITDRDSVSFDTRYGEVYDFVIVLNEKDSCYTRISANYKGVNNPAQIKAGIQADTIPFIMRNSRPYVVGKVNGHDQIYMMLDLGAGITCVNINSVKKTGVTFDGSISVTNTNGTNAEPSSNHTRLQIGNLLWNDVQVVQVRNLADEDDMIIGNSLFRDRILEIDYDKKVLIIHPGSIEIPDGNTKHEVLYDQHRPKIKINLTIDGKTYEDWFLFDTGRDGTMLIGEDFTGEFDVWNGFETLFMLGTKKIVVIPEVKIGGLIFKEIVTNANDPAHPNGKQSLMGNELLQKFNIILDNQNGFMYLKPNSLRESSYEQWDNFRPKYYAVIAGGVILIALIGWLVFRLFRKLRKSRG